MAARIGKNLVWRLRHLAKTRRAVARASRYKRRISRLDILGRISLGRPNLERLKQNPATSAVRQPAASTFAFPNQA